MSPDGNEAWANRPAPVEPMLPAPAPEPSLLTSVRWLRWQRRVAGLGNGASIALRNLRRKPGLWLQRISPGLPWQPGTGLPATWQQLPWQVIAWRSARIFGWGLGCYAGLVLVLTILYAVVNPPASTLMLGQALHGVPMHQTWVPLREISPNLIKAVVISEDAQFCSHWGVDWEAMAEAWDNGGRGASTIPMQTVKNLFLWPGRNYIRKIVELPLAHLTTLVWSKQRMLEIYLNVAEWGPGIYGIEEAAQRSFGRSAKSLTAQEATLLAASLPAPLLRNANAPSRRASAHASRVLRQFAGSADYLACVLN
jgi:monofunctional glycosyltransferase